MLFNLDTWYQRLRENPKASAQKKQDAIAKADSIYLKKHFFLRFRQCPKMVMLDTTSPYLASVDEYNRAVRRHYFKAVKVLAKQRFNHAIQIEESTAKEMAIATKAALKNQSQTIFDATFIVKNMLIKIDILVKEEEGYSFYELKNSTGIKSSYYDDMAYSWVLLHQAGLVLVECYLLHINKTYHHETTDILPEHFLSEKRLTKAVKRRQNEVSEVLASLEEMSQLSRDDYPIGTYCLEPYGCDYKHHCWKNIPSISLFNMQQMPLKTKLSLYKEGKIALDEIPSNLLEKEIQKKQLRAYISGERIIEKEQISTFLEQLNMPLAFLDFETFQIPTPYHQNLRPYEPMPFAFSLHILKCNKVHVEDYIAKDVNQDGRKDIAKLLSTYITPEMKLVAYNAPFERQVLRKLALDVPVYAEALNAMADRVVDLMIPFAKGWVVDQKMNGKHSLKMVLPALFPKLSYDNLEIGDGGLAMNQFILLNKESKKVQKEIRGNLSLYCSRDTEALVKIYQYLVSLVK